MLSLATTALCLWGTGAITPPAPQPSRDVFWMAFSWLGTFGFAGCALLLTSRLLDRSQQIVIDHRGILWRRQSHEPIPWQAISRVEVKSVQGVPFLCLWLRDPGAHRRTGPAGWSDGLNRALGFGDVSLSATGLDRSFDDLVDALGRYRSDVGG